LKGAQLSWHQAILPLTAIPPRHFVANANNWHLLIQEVD
jgi:hypothetical protein